MSGGRKPGGRDTGGRTGDHSEILVLLLTYRNPLCFGSGTTEDPCETSGGEGNP